MANSFNNEYEKDIRRITIFVSDLLHSPSKGQEWMKTPRFKENKNAIEMIQEGNLGIVMQRIVSDFFPS